MSDLTGQSFLDEALNDPGAPPPVPAPAPAAPTSGGYGPLIEAKRKELAALEEKLDTHRETGAYIYRTSAGADGFDDVQYRDDHLRVNKLDRELRDLYRKQDEHRRLLEARRTTVNEVARAVFRRESAKVPEGRRKALAEAFAGMFQSVPDGEWAKSMYGDRATMEAAIVQLVQTAYGGISLGGYAGASPSGLEEEQPPADEGAPVDDVDDFTNNVLYALEQRRGGSMSVADRRRAEAAKEGGTR